jgi:hypothetical protein
MPPRPRTYQYSSQDSPLTVASQFNLQPNQIISANPGGYPFSTGQTINIPTLFQQTLGQRAPAYTPPLGQNRTPSNFQQALQTSYPNAYGPQQPTSYNNQSNFQQQLRRSYPGQFPLGQESGNVIAGSASWPQSSQIGVQGGYQGMTPGNSQSFDAIYNRLSTLTPEQAEAQLAGLPPSLREAVENAINGAAGAPMGVDAQGNSYTADESQSPGGRFIQVGEKRWERNKNGRLVRVQYTGGGSWRNKRVISGGKNQSRNANNAAQPRVDPNGRLAGVGVVNFNVGSG